MYDASQKIEIQDKSFDILFKRTPLSILGTDRIEGIELALNRLEGARIYFHFYFYIHYFVKKFIGEKAVITDEKHMLNCELAFRSIGYRSVQVDPDVPFDKSSFTVPQNTGAQPY